MRRSYDELWEMTPGQIAHAYASLTFIKNQAIESVRRNANKNGQGIRAVMDLSGI